MDGHGSSDSPRLAAAFVAAALAAVTLGLLALLRYGSARIDAWLTWRPAAEMVGPSVLALGVGLASWFVMAVLGRPRRVSAGLVAAVLVLIAVALVLAFPPFDQLVS